MIGIRALWAATFVAFTTTVNVAGAQAAATGQASLQARIDSAPSGAVLELGRGTFAGPATIDKPLVLRGGIVEGLGHGSTLVLRAPGTVIDGVTVRDSGKDLSGPDACIWLEKSASGAVVRGNTLSGCAFGIWVNETRGAQILHNRVIGSEQGNRSDRGNGIQLFNASELLVQGNHVTGGRDGIYVSATENSRIVENRIFGTRIGVHYMFSYDNRLQGNVVSDNQSGLALMESQRIVAIDNTAEKNEEHGILFRDAEYCRIERNRMTNNGEGIFFFSSTENLVKNNVIVGNTVGAKIWAGSVRNTVEGNVFGANRQQVFYVGHDDLLWGTDRPGNFWSDYLGWDQNGDGIGDRPYRVDSFSAMLIHRFPAAALLLRSPALELLSHLEETLPILRVPTVVDERPRLGRAP